jgi:hypothetical protein
MNRLASILLTAVVINSTAFAQIPQPPELPSIEDINAPTRQTVNIHALLAFLPDTLAKVGDDFSVSRADVATALEPKLKMAMHSGRSFTREQLKQAVKQRVDQVVNQRLMLALARDAGIEPDVKAVEAQIAGQRKKMGAQFDVMLKMQGKTADSYAAMISEFQAIDKWVKSGVISKIKVPDTEVAQAFQANPTAYAKGPAEPELTDALKKQIHSQLMRRKIAEAIDKELRKARQSVTVEIFI